MKPAILLVLRTGADYPRDADGAGLSIPTLWSVVKRELNSVTGQFCLDSSDSKLSDWPREISFEGVSCASHPSERLLVGGVWRRLGCSGRCASRETLQATLVMLATHEELTTRNLLLSRERDLVVRRRSDAVMPSSKLSLTLSAKTSTVIQRAFAFDDVDCRTVRHSR